MGFCDYFYVGVVAYKTGNHARNGFLGPLSHELLHPVSRIAETPLRVETRMKRVAGEGDDILEQTVKFPVWFEPQSRGKTSMCSGLNATVEVLAEWCSRNSRSFPPTVLHVTDGHPTDGDPEPIAVKIKRLGTEDGTCLRLTSMLMLVLGRPTSFPTMIKNYQIGLRSDLSNVQRATSPCNERCQE